MPPIPYAKKSAEERAVLKQSEKLRKKNLAQQRDEAEIDVSADLSLFPAAANKLVGFDWFRSIGSPRHVIAPMVDQSELAYRMLTRRYGATLVYTQMFNSTIFCESAEYRRSNFDTCIGDRPLVVQFAGHDPDLMLRSALYVQDKCDAVDVNLGCPQGIAKKGRYGAFLMEELDVLTAIVSKLSKNLRIPVTCKTRIYKDFDRAVRLCETLVDAGASLLTIHGRTREEKGQLVKEVDWDTIRRLKEHFRPGGVYESSFKPEGVEGVEGGGHRVGVPIIANGGIYNMNHVQECLSITSCDGVMSSEGVLENPGLFSANMRSYDNGCTKYRSQIDLAEEYLEFIEQYPTWHYRTMRSHMQKMLHRYSSVHTDLRDMIGSSHELSEFRACISRARDLVEQQREKMNVDGYSLSTDESFSTEIACTIPWDENPDAADKIYAKGTWYHRHQRSTIHPHSGRATLAMDHQRLHQTKYSLLNDMEHEEEPEGDFKPLLGMLANSDY